MGQPVNFIPDRHTEKTDEYLGRRGAIEQYRTFELRLNLTFTHVCAMKEQSAHIPKCHFYSNISEASFF